MGGTGKECMTSILLAENTLEDGSIRDERLLSDATATLFLGKYIDKAIQLNRFTYSTIRHYG